MRREHGVPVRVGGTRQLRDRLLDPECAAKILAVANVPALKLPVVQCGPSCRSDRVQPSQALIRHDALVNVSVSRPIIDDRTRRNASLSS